MQARLSKRLYCGWCNECDGRNKCNTMDWRYFFRKQQYSFSIDCCWRRCWQRNVQLIFQLHSDVPSGQLNREHADQRPATHIRVITKSTRIIMAFHIVVHRPDSADPNGGDSLYDFDANEYLIIVLDYDSIRSDDEMRLIDWGLWIEDRGLNLIDDNISAAGLLQVSFIIIN